MGRITPPAQGLLSPTTHTRPGRSNCSRWYTNMSKMRQSRIPFCRSVLQSLKRPQRPWTGHAPMVQQTEHRQGSTPLSFWTATITLRLRV